MKRKNSTTGHRWERLSLSNAELAKGPSFWNHVWVFGLSAWLLVAPVLGFWALPSQASASVALAPAPHLQQAVSHAATSTVPQVPFYSQFKDISSPKWQKVGCGITSLTMLIDYYHPDAVTVNSLLKQGVAAGAYDYNAGWIYQGMIDLSHSYGLDGHYYNLTALGSSSALERLASYTSDGPVMVVTHYKFDPKSTIPHLVVVDAIRGNTVYYNDPAAKKGELSISTSDFLKGWKKKVIVFRPSDSFAMR